MLVKSTLKDIEAKYKIIEQDKLMVGNAYDLDPATLKSIKDISAAPIVVNKEGLVGEVTLIATNKSKFASLFQYLSKLYNTNQKDISFKEEDKVSFKVETGTIFTKWSGSTMLIRYLDKKFLSKFIEIYSSLVKPMVDEALSNRNIK